MKSKEIVSGANLGAYRVRIENLFGKLKTNHIHLVLHMLMHFSIAKSILKMKKDDLITTFFSDLDNLR